MDFKPNSEFFLQTQGANCLTVGEDFIFIGCSDGIVRCFSPHTLQFITTLPRTHYLGVDVSKGLTISHMVSCVNFSVKNCEMLNFDQRSAQM